MTLKNHKITLQELLDKQHLFNNFYRGVQDWDRVMQVAEQVLSPIRKMIKTHDEKLKQFRDDSKAAPEKAKEITKVYQDMLDSTVELKLAVITEEEAQRSALTPGELAEMLEFVQRDKKQKPEK